MAEIILSENSTAPATPDPNNVVIYAKSDGFMYSKADTGVETLMSSAGLTLDQILNIVSLRA